MRQFLVSCFKFLVNKNPLIERPTRGFITMRMPRRSVFLYGNRIFFTNFHTTFTAHALFRVHRHGFSVLHFKNFHRAHVHAFFTTNTLFFINNRVKSHFKKTSLKSNHYPRLSNQTVFLPSGFTTNNRIYQVFYSFSIRQTGRLSPACLNI